MKKKVPPVRYSKQTQTYPLRGDPVVPKPQLSPEISPKQPHEVGSETHLHSSSTTFFKPRISKPLELESSLFSMPQPSPEVSSQPISVTMKKKVPPVRYSKQTQTYPLRGEPVVPKPQLSPEISPKQPHEVSSESHLHSSSTTFFKPRISKPLELESSRFAMPQPSPEISSQQPHEATSETHLHSSSMTSDKPIMSKPLELQSSLFSVPQPSPAISSQQPIEATSETHIHSSSTTSFKPRTSKPLELQSSLFSIQQPSAETSSKQPHETGLEMHLYSSSMTSFQPRMSKALVQSNTFSIPSTRSSIEMTSPQPKSSESSSSFVMWIPKPRLTITASASLMSTNQSISSSYFTPRKGTFLNLSASQPRLGTLNIAPSDSASLLDPIISPMKQTASDSSSGIRSPAISLQSYQNSLNFFGAYAVTAPLTSSGQQPESRKSYLKPRFSNVLQIEEFQSRGSEESSNRSSPKDVDGWYYSGGSEKSTSAVSNTKQYSNPLSSYKTIKSSTVKPRSVSQALSDMSRSATIRTRFAVPEQVEDGVTAVPWCVRSKCCYSCCMGCSVYDPICNIQCCCPYIQIFWLCTLAFGFFSFWITLFAIWGEAAWPGGEIFEFYTLAAGAYIAGWILACINIPPTLGMFAAGILFGSMGWAHARSSISTTTRAIVVAFVLLRAGLNTDATIFKTRGGLISRMAFIPGLSEMFVASMFGAFMLKMPWFWACLFGSVIAALSPLAIIYSLVRLRENGYGENKRITSVLLMMYALDNITLVTLFGIFFTLTFDVQFSDGRAIGFVVIQILASICGGIGVGFLMGTFITFFPHRYDPYCGIWRTVLLSCSGLGTILLSHILNWDGAGYLCTIVMAFTASVGWKSLGTPNCINPVNMVFAIGWHVLQPIALGLIGAEVNIAVLEQHSIKTALIVVLCCMMQTRFTMAFLMSGMEDFNYKERLFIALLSMTKGTPQAALAPMTMDLAEGATQTRFAKYLLHVCVIEVLITLPLGPLIASFMGTKLLTKSEPSESRTSFGTYLPRHESWSESGSAPVRQRYKSIVSRINTDNEFMLFTETGGDDLTSESYV